MNTKVISLAFSGWIFVMSATILSLQGCYQDDCGPFLAREISAIEFNSFSIQEKMSGQSQDQYKIAKYAGEAISYDSVLIKVDLIVETVSEKNFGITSAFACSPAALFIVVNQLSITSDADYNAEYPAGSNLIDLFDIQRDLLVSSGQSLKSYLTSSRGEFNEWESYYLSISAPPENQSSHIFKIQMTLENSEVFAVTTEGLLIAP